MSQQEPRLQNSVPKGDHFLVEFYGCDFDQIESLDFWQKMLPEAIEQSQMEILKEFFYTFEPHGITGFLLLSTSHLSIHTWPEYGYIACDVFSCSGEEDTRGVVDFLAKHIAHNKMDIQHVKRGYIQEEQ